MEAGVRFDAAVLRRYEASGPRYDSYPTAANFSRACGEDAYLRAAHESNDDPIPRPLSIYVRVPFGAQPCLYRGCTGIISRDPAAIARYLRRLQREVELQARLFDRDRNVDQLHLAGGAPAFLDDRELAELMGFIAHGFALRNDGSREYLIEVDPRTVDESRLASIAGLGFNCISLGVEDFDADVRKAVDRAPPREDILAVIAGARRQGFKTVVVDLIYGLPGQTEAGISRTLEQVIAARPDRVAASSYAHQPQLIRAQTGIRTGDLCPPDVKLALLGLTIENLTAAGYIHIGMDQFALPGDELAIALAGGRLQRNFQGYSTRNELDLVGLGVGAISQVGDLYAQNHRLLEDWAAALDAGRLPVWRGCRLSREDQIRRAVIHTLMCRGELDLREFGERFDLEFRWHFATELGNLAALADDGLVEIEPLRLRVTPLGRLLARAIAMRFDAYLHPESGGETRRLSRNI